MNLDCQKHLFNLEKDVHYLNCAYMSPLLKSVEEQANLELQKRRNPHRYQVDDFFVPLSKLRSLFAEMIRSDSPERIAITPSVSYGMANTAANIPVKKGGSVVIAEGQFPSNYYIWKKYCDLNEVELYTVSKPESGSLWSQAILDRITPDTAAVSLPVYHWADGCRFDLENIGKRCRETDTYLIVDGTQSVGAVPYDNTVIQADALICAGYKWLMGPFGFGLAYYNQRFDNGSPIEESWFSRTNSADFANLVRYDDEYRKGAWKYSVGECSNFIYTGMMIKGLEQILEWGVQEIEAYCKKLTGPVVKRLSELGCVIEDEEWRGNHLFGILPPENFNRKGFTELASREKLIFSQRGNFLRISPNVYNTELDLQKLEACISSFLL